MSAPTTSKLANDAILSRRHADAFAALSKAMIRGKARVAAIAGPPGSGKTFLAYQFGQLFMEQVPGASVSFGYAWSDPPPPPPPDSNRPLLLVIDEYDSTVPTNRPPWWLEATRWKRTRLLFLARRWPKDQRADLVINLSGLSRRDVADLVSARGLNLPNAEIERLASETAGNFRAVETMVSALEAGFLSPSELETVFRPITKLGLVDAAGQPLDTRSEAYERIVVDVTNVSDELLRRLAADPKLLYDLTPRLFEEVVAELLHRRGYEVTLTPASKDGGKDIFAAAKDDLGTWLYLVECKKYAPDRPVGVGLVRQLYGVAQAEKATGAILATTSFFTRGAREFQSSLQFQLSLQDFLSVHSWLRSTRLH